MSKMKMSDVFSGKVAQDGDTILADGYGELADFSGYKREARYAAHAINNHDRMVEEIAELKLSEAELVNRNEDLLCIIDDLTRIARALDKPEKHTNSQHKRAKRDLCNLLTKPNQEGEE